MQFVQSNTRFLGNILSLSLRGQHQEVRQRVGEKYRNLLKRYYARRGSRGIRVMNEAWDYLIILDACRYDYFEVTNQLRGRLEKRVSLGSNTSEWLKKNFTGYYDDVIYISANPHCSDHEIAGFIGTEHFFKVENVWNYGWSEKLDTVPPHEVTNAALCLKDMYPDKRMIIHYIQPHGPWIGKTRITVDEMGFDSSLAMFNDRWVVDTMAWNLVKAGKLDVALLKQATLDNLTLALTEVERLVNELTGKVVVSADHGEAFGEKGIYEHTAGIYTKELVEVPWLVIDKGPKQVVSNILSPEWVVEDGLAAMPPLGKDKVADRLRALGYFE